MRHGDGQRQTQQHVGYAQGHLYAQDTQQDGRRQAHSRFGPAEGAQRHVQYNQKVSAAPNL